MRAGLAKALDLLRSLALSIPPGLVCLLAGWDYYVFNFLYLQVRACGVCLIVTTHMNSYTDSPPRPPWAQFYATAVWPKELVWLQTAIYHVTFFLFLWSFYRTVTTVASPIPSAFCLEDEEVSGKKPRDDCHSADGTLVLCRHACL